MRILNRAKITRDIISSCAIIVLILLGISCKKNEVPEKITNLTDYFFGDSTMAQSDYFKLIIGENGYNILKKQSDLYRQKYFDSEKDNLPNVKKGNLTIKLIKGNPLDKNNPRILLYTFVDNKKVDSLQFYRSSNNIRYSSDVYTCLSYFDEKTNKIWQARFFSYDKDKQWDIASYKQSTILSDGKIKNDSLYYLDESLEVEMEKHNLYY